MNMETTLRALKMTVIGALLLGPLAACNTIAGAGQDLESAGGAIEDKARDVQD